MVSLGLPVNRAAPTRAEATKAQLKIMKSKETPFRAEINHWIETGKVNSPVEQANAERLAHCWNCHDDLLRIAKGLIALRRPCERCDESGKEPLNPEDACHDCGGLGEHCDAAELLHDARAAIARATDLTRSKDL
jgi:hypothetical protein